MSDDDDFDSRPIRVVNAGHHLGAWLLASVFIVAGAAYVTRAPTSPSGCTYQSTLMDRGTRLMQKAGLAVHSLNGPVPTAKITDTVRGTWQTLGFWFGTFGAAVQGRTAPVAAPVRCGDPWCPPGQQPPSSPSAPDPATLTHRSGLRGASLAADAARHAGFPASQIPMAVTVAKYESGWNPLAVNNWKPTAHMRGMWQIYEEVHRDLMRFGDWRDPYVNARMAYRVWRAAGGSWAPWSTAATARRNLMHVSAAAFNPAPGAPPLNDSLTPKVQASCSSPTAPPPSAPGAVVTPGGIRTVKDVTSGIVYHVPIPTGPRGVALNFALDQEAQGDWYQWATRGPDRWDCSGLVSEAWKKAGVNFTPQTEAMRREIPTTSTPQPGDLTYHPGHTQMIVGVIGGRMIIVEAAHPGERLRIRPQWMHPTAYLDPTKMRGRNA